ncbi:MAG: hypothetical protein HC913_10065 [Microscillaceae bacterium]|nr:hypothetical protein [Microscillaceae bacterium]
MNPYIPQLRAHFAKTGKLFMIKPGEEPDEDRQAAAFLFLGKHKGQEVVFDAFMMTLIQDYRLNLMEQTEERMFNLHPELEAIQYEEMEEALQDEYDEIFEEIYRADLIKVQESLEIQESDDDPLMVEVDVVMDIRKIDEKAIEDFVRTFTAGAFEVNEHLRSFDIDDEL